MEQYEKDLERTESQCGRILKYLQEGHSLTPLDALKKFGCFRLGARIWDLKDKGYNIHTDIIKVGKSRVASYSLIS